MTFCPFATWRPVGNHGGRMTAHLGLVLHVQEGNGALSGWFNNPAAQASSTWWVGKNGALEQYVDADLSAWAQAAGNGQYNSIETEGYHTESLTTQQESTLARLYTWGVQTYRWPVRLAEAPGQPGFAWHGMGGGSWGGHTGCPGDLRKNRRSAILAAVSGQAAPSPAPPKPIPPKPLPASVPALHVDYFGRLHNPTVPDVRVWQAKMAARGWKIAADGDFGPASESVAKQFQAEKKLGADGLVGPKTWAATWTAPVT